MADGRRDAILRTVLVTSDAHGFSGSLHESTAPLSAHDMDAGENRLGEGAIPRERCDGRHIRGRSRDGFAFVVVSG
jgi:hypothetical protein